MRRAGERRHSVELQAPGTKVAAGDGYTQPWDTYATVWAAVVPAGAALSERVSGNTQQVPITHVVELDYRADLKASHRVWFQRARPLYIRGIQNEDERNKTYVLSCEERAE